MIDHDLSRLLHDASADLDPHVIPDTVWAAGRRRQRRTLAAVTTGAVASIVAVVGITAVVTHDEPGRQEPAPVQPATSPTSGEESMPSLAEPTHDDSDYPSGLTVSLPGRDRVLPADTSCWRGPEQCRRGLILPGDPVPDLGSGDAIDFRFARPGWTFSAIFRRVGDDCPRASTIETVPTGEQSFRLTPAGEAGRYEVELGGDGPEGFVSTRFLWTTTSDGPVDPPKGSAGLFPESRGEGSFALEVMMDDLAFHPTNSELSRSVEVAVTSENGRERTLSAALESLYCGPRGSRGTFYYQAEWDEDISVLGQSPFDLEVTLTIRGTTYVGRATWQQGQTRSGHVPLAFTPPLPAAGVD